MRVLFLDQFGDLGGAQLSLVDLAAYLRQSGAEPCAAVPPGGPLADRLRGAGIPVFPMPVGSYSGGRKSPADLFRFARELPGLADGILRLTRLVKPRLLYVNGPRLMPAAAHSPPAAPIVFHAHNWVSPLAGKPLLRWAVYATGARVIAASRFVARQWPGAVVAHGGVASPPGGPPARVPDGAFRVGLVGRMAPQKRQREFVAAAKLISARLPSARFVVCGQALFGDEAAAAYQRSVVALASPEVEFTGWTNRVSSVLSSLDLLVVPSANEGGIPRVVLEAFAARVPVLALNSGAIPEAVAGGKTGFLLRSPAPAEIAEAVLDLAPRTDLLAQVAAEAHRLWQAHFRLEHFGGKIEALLERIVRGGRP